MNNLTTNNDGQQKEQAELTTRFSPFGAFVVWLGLVPLYLAMIPTNPILNVIGTVALGLHLFFVYNRCDELGLMTVKVLKKNDDDDDRLLVLTVMICFIAMIAYFAFIGFNPKIFLSSYAILATIITFRVQALNEYKPGEL